MRERAQTRGEEVANTLSHGLGLAAALAASPLLVAAAWPGGAAAAAGGLVFAVSVVLLYCVSTIYHALPAGRLKRAFQQIDHAAIYLLIAGSYTPFTLGVLRGTLGWTLLGIIWSLALGGILVKAAGGLRCDRWSTGLYLAMGWLILVAAKPLWERMSAEGLAWLAAGGLAYSVGVVFYFAGRLRFGHFIWHLFVLAGTACHFVAVWRHAG